MICFQGITGIPLVHQWTKEKILFLNVFLVCQWTKIHTKTFYFQAIVGLALVMIILLSLLAYALLPCRFLSSCQVLFLWTTRSQKQYEWMIDILREVEAADRNQIIKIHIFITQFRSKFDLRTIMLVSQALSTLPCFLLSTTLCFICICHVCARIRSIYVSTYPYASGTLSIAKEKFAVKYWSNTLSLCLVAFSFLVDFFNFSYPHHLPYLYVNSVSSHPLPFFPGGQTTSAIHSFSYLSLSHPGFVATRYVLSWCNIKTQAVLNFLFTRPSSSACNNYNGNLSVYLYNCHP